MGQLERRSCSRGGARRQRWGANPTAKGVNRPTWVHGVGCRYRRKYDRPAYASTRDGVSADRRTFFGAIASPQTPTGDRTEDCIGNDSGDSQNDDRQN